MKKADKISPRREFYSNIDKIRDLYENQGFLFATELYRELKFNMTYQIFCRYFNEEIKNKTPKENNKKDKIIESTIKAKDEPIQKESKPFEIDQTLLSLVTSRNEMMKR